MIYSASRRTDMPAFFPDAIADRVLRSRRLEAIVFWTKDIRNLVRHPRLAEVVGRVPAVVQFTVTGLAGTVWEPLAPPLAEQAGELAELARRLPRGAIRWRFDPIVPGTDAGAAEVLERFRGVKNALEAELGEVDGVTVSFPDPYRKAVARTAAGGMPWPVFQPEDRKRIVAAMVEAFANGKGDAGVGPVRLCCEPELLELPGVARASCIDGGLFARLYGLAFEGLEKDPGQRVACGCVKSTDIGTYDMRCGHRCLYCYANPD